MMHNETKNDTIVVSISVCIFGIVSWANKQNQWIWTEKFMFHMMTAPELL